MAMWTDPGRVFYEGRSAAGGAIRVTSAWCQVGETGYPIEELDVVGVARGARRGWHGGRVVGVLAVGVALIAVAVAIAVGWTRQIWPAITVALIGTVALTILPSALDRVLRRPYEIWAEYRGAGVRLFVTEDREQYGQVARALVRAREWHGR
jgi:hypothetical protein